MNNHCRKDITLLYKRKGQQLLKWFILKMIIDIAIGYGKLIVGVLYPVGI